MNELQKMTVRELICELSRVEDALRLARVPKPLDAVKDVRADLANVDALADLAVLEQQIVRELRRRRALGPRAAGAGLTASDGPVDPPLLA
ncbi:MAG: hypothetical protein ACRDPG_00550 [Nocardioidaceae bacterium]